VRKYTHSCDFFPFTQDYSNPKPRGARPVSFFGEGANPEAVYNLCLNLKKYSGVC